MKIVAKIIDKQELGYLPLLLKEKFKRLGLTGSETFIAFLSPQKSREVDGCIKDRGIKITRRCK